MGTMIDKMEDPDFSRIIKVREEMISSWCLRESCMNL